MAKLLWGKNKNYLVRDESKDFHCNKGFIKSKDILNSKPGDILKTNTGHCFYVLSPDFIDFYKKIKRGPQIIPRKDIGLIITETGLNKGSVVIETGSGSGGLGLFLSMICKKVYSYEIREDFFNLAKSNIEFLGIKNYIVKNKDSKLGFNEKNVDVIVLDLPDPWELIKAAKKSLKIGGFLVSYSPSIPQVMDFVESLDDSFDYIKTSEIIEREWEINKRKVRPKSQAIGHSGFISFVRRIR